MRFVKWKLYFQESVKVRQSCCQQRNCFFHKQTSQPHKTSNESNAYTHTHILPTLSDSPDGAVKSASDFKTLVTLLIKPIIWILQLKHISYISSQFSGGKIHLHWFDWPWRPVDCLMCSDVTSWSHKVNSARNCNKHPSTSTMLTPIISVFATSWWTVQFAEHLFYYKSQTKSSVFFQLKTTFSSWTFYTHSDHANRVVFHTQTSIFLSGSGSCGAAHEVCTKAMALSME